MKIILIALLALEVATLAVLVALLAVAAQPQPSTLGPCVMEDSDNCYWDATSRGNGSGASFIAMDGQVYYLSVTP